MKKYFLLAIVFGLFACGIAEAGVFSSVKEYFAENAVYGIISAIFLIIGAFFAGAAKWKSVAIEGTQFALAIKHGIDPKSPGGKKLTQDEMDVIVKELGDIFPALAQAMATTAKKQ